MVAALSESEMAAHQIALQVIHFSFMPAFAISEAASVLTGQAVGADRDDLVPKVAKAALSITSLYTGACTLVVALGALGGWIGLCAEIFLGAGILWWRPQKKHWLSSAKRSRAQLQAKSNPPS